MSCSLMINHFFIPFLRCQLIKSGHIDLLEYKLWGVLETVLIHNKRNLI